MIHLYTGDGKGKTTAAAGLALRALGHGKRVLFCQFLKDGRSGELEPLRGLGAEVSVVPHSGKFTFQMSPGELEAARAAHRAFWGEISAKIRGDRFDLIVLDEAVDAVNLGMIPREALLALLGERQPAEFVLTGRGPAPELCALADYHTEFTALAHPYNRGIAAREGIEW